MDPVRPIEHPEQGRLAFRNFAIIALMEPAPCVPPFTIATFDGPRPTDRTPRTGPARSSTSPANARRLDRSDSRKIGWLQGALILRPRHTEAVMKLVLRPYRQIPRHDAILAGTHRLCFSSG